MSDESVSHYLNTETGEIILVSQYSMSRDELEELEEEREDEKYSRVPQIRSNESYEFMAGFTSTVKDQKVHEALTEALNGRKPFRRFKDALGDFPQKEKRWYQFEEETHRQVILDWLRKEGIEIPYHSS